MRPVPWKDSNLLTLKWPHFSQSKLTDSFRRAAESRPELDADEGSRADDVAEDDDDRQLYRLDLGPRDAFDGAGARRERDPAFATVMAAAESGSR